VSQKVTGKTDFIDARFPCVSEQQMAEKIQLELRAPSAPTPNCKGQA